MKVVTILAIFLLLVVPLFLLGGFIWMICLGALSHIFDIPKLAIGYWPSVLVGVIFSLLFGGAKGSKN